jgi:antitoxin MazE
MQAVREGWAEASRTIADAGDDELVWPEFSDADDDELAWAELDKPVGPLPKPE